VHWLLIRWWSQTTTPPQSLHFLLCRWRKGRCRRSLCTYSSLTGARKRCNAAQTLMLAIAPATAFFSPLLPLVLADVATLESNLDNTWPHT